MDNVYSVTLPRQTCQRLGIGIVPQLRRQFRDQTLRGPGNYVPIDLKICVQAGAAGEADVFLTFSHIGLGGRQFPGCGKQINLKRHPVSFSRLVEHVLWGVFETRPPSQ